MYSAYKLHQQGDKTKPWCASFPTWNQSIVPLQLKLLFHDLHTDFSGCKSDGLALPSHKEFSTVCCDPHTFKGFSVVNEAEVDVFLEFSCFLYDLTDTGNLISFSSAFSKTSLNIWNYLSIPYACVDFPLPPPHWLPLVCSLCTWVYFFSSIFSSLFYYLDFTYKW